MSGGFGIGLRALIVDDDEAPRIVLQVLMEEEGFAVTTATGFVAARDALADGQFDLVITDKNMPDGSGLELLRAIRGQGLDLEMLMVTGYASVEGAMEAMQLGVADYLTKPFDDLDAVKARVNRAVDMLRLRRQNKELLTDLREKNAELESLAVRDPLTRLYNHAFLQESLEREITRTMRHGTAFGLLFIDLDNFKDVNDTFGHSAGDRLLTWLADVLMGKSRQSDIGFRLRAQDVAARYGGDEFAIILPETPKGGATIKAEHFRSFIDAHDYSDLGIMHQTVSIGVSAFPDDANTRRSLIDAADRALYGAKRSGRNRIVAFTPALGSPDGKEPAVPEQEEARAAALERVIAGEELSFVYQAIVAADSGKTVGYEAFCRPQNPVLENPAVLIDTAERMGKVGPLGRAMRACSVAALERLPEDVLLFVNLHQHELYDSRLTGEEDDLNKWSSRIVFEITESAVRDYERLRQTLDRLRSHGFGVALSDLREGYEGVAAIDRLNPEYVKLHASFIRSATEDPRAERALKHLLEFAAGENMTVIAEGIETLKERDRVAGLGCPWLQGYHFGRGEPLDAILA